MSKAIGKQKLSPIAYVKTALVVLAFFYAFVKSGIATVQYIKEGKDAMNPMMAFMFCLAILIYMIVGVIYKSKPNPLDKKIGWPIISLVIILFFAMVGFLCWFTRDIRH